MSAGSRSAVHCTRANCAVDRARQRARERGLADARVVLDEDVALGEQRDDDVLEHLVADLDRAADVVRDALRDGDRGLDLGGRRRALGFGFLDGLHSAAAPLRSVDERRLKTASRIAPRRRSFAARGTCCSPSAVTIAPRCRARRSRCPASRDVVDDDGVEALARRACRAPYSSAPLAVLGGEADQHLAGAAASRRARTARPRYARARGRALAASVLLELVRRAASAGR